MPQTPSQPEPVLPGSPPATPATTTGVIELGEPPLAVGPHTAFDAVWDSEIAKTARVHLGAKENPIELRNVPAAGLRWYVTLWFESDTLVRTELVEIRADDGASWNDWTLEKEMARKASHEAWIERVFGAAPAVEPYVLDDKPVYPFIVEARNARSLRFAWGRVGSYYDEKAGMALITIRYGRHGVS